MSPADKTRKELSALGERRAKLRKMEEKLAEDTKVAISHARRDSVPMSEAANLVGLERTTIYQVYDEARKATSNGRRQARSAVATT